MSRFLFTKGFHFMNVVTLLTAYFAIINLIGFFIMGLDKRRAVKHAFRIPEATLFTIAIIGGSLGSIIGMYYFHHKTRHWYFVYGMPFILILQILLLFFLYNGPFEIAFL